ncbi:MAG: hypothetical protein KC442_04230 [Thermomicrobiales bacterium]|nr:hypothetical protein [Thermomicrobiales bacterium]
MISRSSVSARPGNGPCAARFLAQAGFADVAGVIGGAGACVANGRPVLSSAGEPLIAMAGRGLAPAPAGGHATAPPQPSLCACRVPLGELTA